MGCPCAAATGRGRPCPASTAAGRKPGPATPQERALRAAEAGDPLPARPSVRPSVRPPLLPRRARRRSLPPHLRDVIFSRGTGGSRCARPPPSTAASHMGGGRRGLRPTGALKGT